MKTIIVLATLVATQAFAGGLCSRSWSSLNRDYSVSADFPKVQFGSTQVSVDGLCVAGEDLKTVKPVAVCTRWSTGEGSECLSQTKSHLTTPVSYSKDIPDGEGSFRTIELTHKLTHSIPVGHYQGEAGFVAVCNKSFTIPACK